MQNKVIVVAGPTGVGKTKKAEEIAKEVGGELINADSRQNYKYLDIGTNKGIITATQETDAAGLPVWLTQNGIRIHHISFVEPDGYFTAADFQRNVAIIMQDLLERNITPIVVGGTGLYIQSLLEAEKYNFQAKDTASPTEATLSEIQEQLKQQYPNVWLQVNESDKQNLPHLLGILRRQQRLQANQMDSEIINFLKTVEWDLRYVDLTFASHRIALMDRIEEMWPDLIKEVKNLLKNFSPDVKALQTIGYIQAIDFINKKLDAQTAMNQIFSAHWQYARRQRLWFEKFYFPKAGISKRKEPSINKLFE